MLVLDQWYLFLDLQTVPLSLDEQSFFKYTFFLLKSHKEKNIEKCREMWFALKEMRGGVCQKYQLTVSRGWGLTKVSISWLSAGGSRKLLILASADIWITPNVNKMKCGLRPHCFLNIAELFRDHKTGLNLDLVWKMTVLKLSIRNST